MGTGMFNLGDPGAIWPSALLAPLLAALYYAGAIMRRRAMARFAEPALHPLIAPWVSPWARRLRAALMLLAVGLMIFSLMRPQWGYTWEEIRQSGLDILIAVDTSRSMLAEDMRPNRLERAKLAVKDLMMRLRGDRVGIVAFAGEAYLASPLTTDYSGVMLALDDLYAGIVPTGGTSLSSAIGTALESFGGGVNKYKALVIITDGEDLDGDAMEAARRAAREGLRIYTIGLGSGAGELIPVRGDGGGVTFLKDPEGNVVKSRLNERLLGEMALATGGAYVRASSLDVGLVGLYEEKLSGLETRQIEDRRVRRYTERYQIPLALGLCLILIEPFIWESRRGQKGGLR